MLDLQNLKDFSIHAWYETFKDISLPTTIVEVPNVLVQKFQSNDSYIDMVEACPSECMAALANAITTFNNNAFVKNNWHAPMDAKMCSLGGLLKVTNITDLFLYLSTSNTIDEDFSSQKNGIPFYLALKPWKNIHPASEFRCIVVNNVLRGITPRDFPTYYPHFKEEGSLIIETLTNFFKENIALRFPRKHYTFDVIMAYPGQPCVIDFGPLNCKSTLYAFSWKEISSLLNKDCPEGVAPVFRYLDSDIGIIMKTDAINKIAKAFA